jgi:hypothetical protein
MSPSALPNRRRSHHLCNEGTADRQSPEGPLRLEYSEAFQEGIYVKGLKLAAIENIEFPSIGPRWFQRCQRSKLPLRRGPSELSPSPETELRIWSEFAEGG